MFGQNYFQAQVGFVKLLLMTSWFWLHVLVTQILILQVKCFEQVNEKKDIYTEYYFVSTDNLKLEE